MAILLRLLFAHILSDFVFQNDKICEGKQEKTSKKYVYQLLHSLIHALIAYLFCCRLEQLDYSIGYFCVTHTDGLHKG